MTVDAATLSAMGTTALAAITGLLTYRSAAKADLSAAEAHQRELIARLYAAFDRTRAEVVRAQAEPPIVPIPRSEIERLGGPVFGRPIRVHIPVIDDCQCGARRGADGVLRHLDGCTGDRPPDGDPIYELGQQDPVAWMTPDGRMLPPLPQPAQPTMDLVADEATGTRPKAAATTTVAASAPQPSTSTVPASSRRRRAAEGDDEGVLAPPRWYRLRRLLSTRRAWDRYLTRLAAAGRFSGDDT